MRLEDFKDGLKSDMVADEVRRNRPVGCGMYTELYKTRESKPHYKIELCRLQRYDEDGSNPAHFNEYNKTRLSGRCGYTCHQYSGAQLGRRSDLYLDFMYQLAKDLSVSIDYILNIKSTSNKYIPEEKQLIYKLDRMPVDDRIVCLSVWAFFGIYKLRVLLND